MRISLVLFYSLRTICSFIEKHIKVIKANRIILHVVGSHKKKASVILNNEYTEMLFSVQIQYLEPINFSLRE